MQHVGATYGNQPYRFREKYSGFNTYLIDDRCVLFVQLRSSSRNGQQRLNIFQQCERNAARELGFYF